MLISATKIKTYFILIIFLLILFFPNFSFAATIFAKSCKQEDVQAAIDQAQDGDTVLVPEGECVWGNSIRLNKSLTLKGKGTAKTKIIDETGNNWEQSPIWAYPIYSKVIRITGFTFKRTKDFSDSFGTIYIGGNDNIFRIDNCEFTNAIVMRAFITNGKTYGVVDHCSFNEAGYLIMDTVDESWTRPMSFGTSEAVFIEDNTFNMTCTNCDMGDAQYGARVVFRNNKVYRGIIENHGMDSVLRSCLQMEIYNNSFVADLNQPQVWNAIGFRGGTGVVFNNTFTGNYYLPLRVTNYRSCCYAGAACTPFPNPPFGTCDGTNPLDGNTEPKEIYKGWPCKDQVGRGTNQTSEPLYEWNNTKDGSDVDIIVTNTWSGCNDPQPSDHMKENRDYFNDTPRPGYTPYTYPHPFRTDCQNYPMLCDGDTTHTTKKSNSNLIYIKFIIN